MASLGAIAALALIHCMVLFAGSRAAGRPQKPEVDTRFIRTSCGVTAYPDLCFNSLSAYASEIRTSRMQLTCTSLSLASNATRSAYTAVKAISTGGGGMSRRVAAAVRDCKETVGDAADQLEQSVVALGQLGGRDIRFQLNTIQTWVSAAITNDYTCTDGFDDPATGGDVKAAVGRVVMHAEQLTSNALAFINRLAAEYSHSPSSSTAP